MQLLQSLFRRPTKPAERRYYLRLPARYWIVLSWRDSSGKRRSARGRILQMSGAGALVRSMACIEPGSTIYVRSRELGLMGSARVCHCLPGIFTYKIGLEFPGVLAHHA